MVALLILVAVLVGWGGSVSAVVSGGDGVVAAVAVVVVVAVVPARCTADAPQGRPMVVFERGERQPCTTIRRIIKSTKCNYFRSMYVLY